MKIFPSIAAAVIGTSIFAVFAGQAQQAPNGWILVPSQKEDERYYVKPLECKDGFCLFLEQSPLTNGVVNAEMDCKGWRYRWVNSADGSKDSWVDIMPASPGAAKLRVLCPANTPNNSIDPIFRSCEEKVDAVFYKRHPHLIGLKLINMNSPLALEWIKIQDSICR